MESCDLTAYLRDHQQITCLDYYSLQRFTVHGTKVIREHHRGGLFGRILKYI